MHQIIPGVTPGSWQYVIQAHGRRLADADFDGAQNFARLLFTDGTEQVFDLPVREPVVAKVSRKHDTITLRWDDPASDCPAVVAAARLVSAAGIAPGAQANTPQRESNDAPVQKSSRSSSTRQMNGVRTWLDSMDDDAPSLEPAESSRSSAAIAAAKDDSVPLIEDAPSLEPAGSSRSSAAITAAKDDSVPLIEVVSELEPTGAISKSAAITAADENYVPLIEVVSELEPTAAISKSVAVTAANENCVPLIEVVSELNTCRKAGKEYSTIGLADVPPLEPKASTSGKSAAVTGANDGCAPPLEDVPPLEDMPPLEDVPPLEDMPPLEGVPPLEDMPPLEDIPPLEPAGALSKSAAVATANNDRVPSSEDMPPLEDIPPLEPAGALSKSTAGTATGNGVPPLEDVPPLENVPELIPLRKAVKVNCSTEQLNVKVPDDCLNPAAEELFLKMEAQRLKQKEEAKKKQVAAAAKVNKSSFGLKKGFFSSSDKSGDKATSASSTTPAKKDKVIEVAPKKPNENPLQLKEVQDTMKATAKDTSWVTPGAIKAMESKPDLMKGMANPKIQEALELMRTNPQAGLAKYKADPEVMSFINEFSSLMAKHTDAYQNIAGASNIQCQPGQLSTMDGQGGTASTPTEMPVVDKELVEIMQDPEMQHLIHILRTQPVEINAFLARRPHLMPKVKVLIDRKLFNVSTA